MLNNIELELKKQATIAIKSCPLSRYEIAAKMSEILGRKITKTMLNNRTAESKKDQSWPASWIIALAIITNHYGQIKLINEKTQYLSSNLALLDLEISLRSQFIDAEKKTLDELLKIKQTLLKKKNR